MGEEEKEEIRYDSEQVLGLECAMGPTDKTELASLGFGCMRLPLVVSGGTHDIDIDQLCTMTDAFLGAGFRYFDTARGYQKGSGEGALKKALVDRYPRTDYLLATKLPAYLANSKETAQDMFFISLEDTQAEYFDYYLLHNLGGQRTIKYEEYGIWDFVAGLKKDGLVDNIGFSFHGTAQELEDIIQQHEEIDFVQLQINYADWKSDLIQSEQCYNIAREHDLEIVVMEPVKGGLLVDLPPQAEACFLEADPHVSLASWALRFAASLEGVSTVLSGMSSQKQMEENIRIMSTDKPLLAHDHETIHKVQSIITGKRAVACTNCGYCTDVCPQNVCIPQALNALNILVVHDDIQKAQQSYLWALSGKASLCTGCRACETICPQNLTIVEALESVVKEIERDDIDKIELGL